MSKNFLIATKGLLPQGYTRVEYIESSGTQHIDTNFYPNQNTRLVMDIYLPAWSSVQAVFGTRNASKSASFVLWTINNSALRSDYGATTQTVAITYPSRLSIDKDKNTTTINGNSITATESTFQSNYSLLLMALIDSGGIDTRKAIGQIYSCQIYDNGTLVRDYIPCISPSGEVGLYDKANSVFYGNAGSGVFTAGAAMDTDEMIYSKKVNKSYITLGYNTHNIKKGYMVYAHVARLFYSDAVEVSYTGTHTISDVTLDGVAYKLYTLTGSGILAINGRVQYWMCGGGATPTGTGGGGGGYVNSGTLSTGTIPVTIGAAGGTTKIGSAVASPGEVGSRSSSGGAGGSGGGAAYASSDYPPGQGAGISTYPFGLTSLYAHCAGGGAGAIWRTFATRFDGGAGGSNGGNGSYGSSDYVDSTTDGTKGGGAGGIKGGGDGGGNYRSVVYDATSATFYGGGGGGHSTGSGPSSNCGSGYQGVAYLLVPVI